MKSAGYLSWTAMPSASLGQALVKKSSKVCGVPASAGQVATIARFVVPSGTSTSIAPAVTVTAAALAVTAGVPGPVRRKRSRVPVA